MPSQTAQASNHSLNVELTRKAALLSILERDDIGQLVSDFEYDWLTGSCNPKSELFQVFKSEGWIGEDLRLSRLGKLVYGRMALHFDFFDDPANRVVGNYEITSRIRSGKNSAIFGAIHRSLGFKAILKFIRPGASDDIETSLKKIATGTFGPTIVMPSDVIKVKQMDVTGRELWVTCLVFPYISGQPLSDFLNEKSNHLNSHVVISFIKQIGSVLEELERIDAYHGDLHDRNILVDRALGGQIEFKLLDLSFDAVGSLSLQEAQNNDLENFKQHIWRILSVQKESIPNVSLRKFVGTKFYQKIKTIISDKTASFREVMQIFRDDANYARFIEAQTKFMLEKFAPPNSFRLQRYEEFTEPSIASRLFVPFPELQEKINEFGNVYISGNRGSGKSTYLASLAFFPSVDDPDRQFTQIFGIYFPCRQGEFRGLSPVFESDRSDLDRKLLHILVIKVIRRTLESVTDGIAQTKIGKASDYSKLREFLDRFVPKPGIILIESDILSETDNFVATVVRLELDEIKSLSKSPLRLDAALSANDLIEFFGIVKRTFPELKASRFHILFDDAGEPYVQRRVQRIINELIINSNPVYCVKLSAEKNTYVFQTPQGKNLENGHDYYEQDISYSLFIGSGTTGIRREKLEEYFREIVALRLTHFQYRSPDIREYVGDQPNSDERLTTLLALGRKDAYYCGWTTIWNIADRNPRNLLELVSEIFAVGHIERDTEPRRVPMRDQSRAIKTISEKRLQSLSQIAGTLVLNGAKVSLGRKLFEVTVTIGSTFYTYLRQEVRSRKKGGRIRQHLAIERNELDELDPSAEFILQRLETFGVLDSSKSAYSRDDQVKKPIYVLNRIYCPAFSIGYRRDDHLRLSKKRFEQLLLHPQLFLREGTRRLRADARTQIELFGYSFEELNDD